MNKKLISGIVLASGALLLASCSGRSSSTTSSSTSKPVASASTSKPASTSTSTSNPSKSSSIPTSQVTSHEHIYLDQSFDSTCAIHGYTLHTCSICGYSYTSDEKPLAEHNYSNWTITKEPTPTTKGERQRECMTCGHIDIAESDYELRTTGIILPGKTTTSFYTLDLEFDTNGKVKAAKIADSFISSYISPNVYESLTVTYTGDNLTALTSSEKAFSFTYTDNVMTKMNYKLNGEDIYTYDVSINNGAYTLTTDKYVYQYDFSRSLITYSSLSDNYRFDFAYNDKLNPSVVMFTNSLVTTKAYFAYDDNNRLLSIDEFDGGNESSPVKVATINYSYGTEGTTSISIQSLSENYSQTYSYSKTNKLTGYKYITYNEDGTASSKTLTEHEYNNLDLLVKTTTVKEYTDTSKNNAIVTEYEYNSDNKQTSVTITNYNNKEQKQSSVLTTFEYTDTSITKTAITLNKNDIITSKTVNVSDLNNVIQSEVSQTYKGGKLSEGNESIYYTDSATNTRVKEVTKAYSYEYDFTLETPELTKRVIKEFTYGDNHKLTRVVNKEYNALEETPVFDEYVDYNSEGTVIYSHTNRIVKCNPTEFNGATYYVEESDSNGLYVRTYYDANGNVVDPSTPNV